MLTRIDDGSLPDWTVEHDPPRRLLVVRRATERLDPAADGALHAFRALLDAHGIAPAETRVLVDLRKAGLRNADEQEFREAARRRALNAFLQRFDKSCYVVRLAVGKLQVRRYAEEVGVTAQVFDDEAQATAWLLAEPLSEGGGARAS